MKRLIAVLLSVTLGFFGCAFKARAEYSNLADENSRAGAALTLKESGLSKTNVDKVIKWVKDFNKNAQSSALVGKFAKLPEAGMDYSGVFLKETTQEYNYINWLNCRLTAFFLMKDKISTEKTGSDDDTWLMFDIEAIDTVNEFNLSKNERADFITLFNNIPLDKASSLKEHENIITRAWKERNIQIYSENVSLICVYIHSPQENVRFAGHAGVLAKTADGLLFFEKYGNDAPFQLTSFNNKKELKRYLLSRKDIYGSDNELKPIITENGNII